jgi:DNA-binding transcriptional MerR regulator
MRLSELAAASGVSIPTIKFYLREGILPAGRAAATNQAEYDEGHVRRLRLIRALAEVGQMPLATVRGILQAVDDQDIPLHDALGAAHRWLGPELDQTDDPEVEQARQEVDDFLEERHWDVSPDSPGRHELAVALATLRRLGWPNPDVHLFEPYATAADRLAARELRRTTPAGTTRAEAMEQVVIGTVVFDAVFSALRRLAHERHSAARLGSRRAASRADG